VTDVPVVFVLEEGEIEFAHFAFEGDCVIDIDELVEVLNLLLCRQLQKILSVHPLWLQLFPYLLLIVYVLDGFHVFSLLILDLFYLRLHLFVGVFYILIVDDGVDELIILVLLVGAYLLFLLCLPVLVILLVVLGIILLIFGSL
jgi:hypothetical protein